MILNKKLALTLLVALSFLISGCGGETTETPAQELPQNTDPTVSSGIFIDSFVSGITYTTSTQSGLTDALGSFDFIEGEEVVFSIGDIQFPSAIAQANITPLTLANTTDINNQTVINIARLLQTLDEDNNTTNGISISQATLDAGLGFSIDFTLTNNEDFEAAVDAFLRNVVSIEPSLISEEEALDHLSATLDAIPEASDILGSWVTGDYDEQNRMVITFIDSTRYIIFHERAYSSINQLAGTAEYGTYTWTPETGNFSAQLLAENDGNGGFFEEGINLITTINIDASTLTTSSNDTFVKIEDSSVDYVNAWIYTEPINSDGVAPIHILTFLNDYTYSIVHATVTGQSQSHPQFLHGEFGSFYHDNALIYELIQTLDTDSDGGISSNSSSNTLEVTGSSLILFGATTYTKI